MRFAILSDVHGNLLALEAVIDDISRANVDQVFNLGDCLSGPLWPSETADRLMMMGWPTVAGNHDRLMLLQGTIDPDTSDGFAASRINARHRAWLTSLPKLIEPAPDLLLCHGTPTNDNDYWLHRGRPGAMRKADDTEIALHATTHRLALCGHTHVARIVALSDGRVIANAGSVGLPAYDDDPHLPDYPDPSGPRSSYLVVERDKAGIWQVELRLIAYDFERASRQAELTGRMRWAHTLRTGRTHTTERCG